MSDLAKGRSLPYLTGVMLALGQVVLACSPDSPHVGASESDRSNEYMYLEI